MGAESKIEWTDHTFNPWWGCQRVSPECEHCYAETFSRRLGKDLWGPLAPRRFFGDKHWAEPRKWNAAAMKAGRRARVFCASMADVFEDRRDLDEHRMRLFALIRETPFLVWQLLTKRPEKVGALLATAMVDACQAADPLTGAFLEDWLSGHPPANVWLGTTAGTQKMADKRIDVLRSLHAAVRFVSCEPLLERVEPVSLEGIHWLIIGGESGHGSRPLDLSWMRALVRQCREADVACFVKQLGARPTVGGYESGHPLLNLAHDDVAKLAAIRSQKAGMIEEWPDDLRVRQFPKQAI